MALPEDIIHLLEALVGGDSIPTVSQGRPNWVVSLDLEFVYVHTKRSKKKGVEPDRVPVSWLTDVAGLLEERGEVTRNDIADRDARFRSAFVFAVICQLPQVRCDPGPPAVLQIVRSV